MSDETLDVLTRLMAPFVPFVTDYLWQHLHADADSVHLATWPEAADLPADPALVAQMRLVRDLVELGRLGPGITAEQPHLADRLTRDAREQLGRRSFIHVGVCDEQGPLGEGDA